MVNPTCFSLKKIKVCDLFFAPACGIIEADYFEKGFAMIETAKQQERAILVGVELQETEHFDMSMEELASLAKTAGAEVVASYTQKRERYDSKSFVGSGKLEEIKAMVDADEITTVIFNNRLTPRQIPILKQHLA